MPQSDLTELERLALSTPYNKAAAEANFPAKNYRQSAAIRRNRGAQRKRNKRGYQRRILSDYTDDSGRGGDHGS